MFSILSRRYLSITQNEFWPKILLFCFILFLVRMADGIISFWAPVQIQSVLGSSTVMGLIISFQSVVGLIADVIFPKLLRGVRAKRLVFWGIMMSGFTSFFLVNTIFWPFVSIFLVTMALWGIYYELISFASYPLIEGVYSDIAARMGREKKEMMGLTNSMINVSYIIAPPITGLISSRVGERMTFGVVGAIVVVVSVLLLFITPKKFRLPQGEIKTWD